MPNDDEPSREELTEAGKRIRRQIEILRTPAHNSSLQSRQMAVKLRGMLKEIDQCLEDKGSGDV